MNEDPQERPTAAQAEGTGTVKVVFTPSGRRGEIERGTSVLAAARMLGVDLDSVCGGRGICGRCRVRLAEGTHPKEGFHVAAEALSPPNEVEARYDRVRGLGKGFRLGCQARILAPAVIDVPPESQVHRQVVRKDADARPVPMAPATRIRLVEVPPATLEAPAGAAERIRTAFAASWGEEYPAAAKLVIPPALLPALQPALAAGKGTVSLAIHADPPSAPPVLVALWPGFRKEPVFGIAVDVGSTTIALHLADLATGEVVASSGRMNPQIRFGEDLMSRVSHAMMHPGGTAEMTAAVREAIDALIGEAGTEAGIRAGDILEAVFVGNPVMHHLLLGIDPSPLGQAPFALTTNGALRLTARDLGLGALPGEARIYLPPLIAGHVGADAAAVILAEAPHQAEELTLIVDVGTNAEIILGDRNGLLACSSPTGPAFEGAQISAGQRAAPGAIERVRIDPVTKEPRFKVIGVAPWSDEEGFTEAVAEVGITGICGSGIIEAVAEMRMAGILDAAGLIGAPEAVGSARIVTEGRTHAYVLHDARREGGPRIAITQNDVRAIQLAKSALHAGARLLMDERGVERVDRIVLAGAFGAHISPLHAMVLGMIPDAPLEKVVSAGNAAGTGARLALASCEARAEIEEVVRHIRKVETAIAPRFQEHFVAANAIPHAHEPYTELRKVVDLPEIDFNAARRAARDAEGGGRRRRRRRS